jgi:hypothetical protein
LREFGAALDAGDADRAIALTRAYYQRVDRAFMQALAGVMTQLKSNPLASSGPFEDEPRH